MKLKRSLVRISAAVLGAGLLTACGGEPPSNSSSPDATSPTAIPVATATAPTASPAPATVASSAVSRPTGVAPTLPRATATSAAGPSCGRTAGEEVAAAEAAARLGANGAPVDCPECIRGGGASPDRGIVIVSIRNRENTEGIGVIWGRDSSCNWQRWFATQNVTYHALILPAEMRVCAGGDSVNVRSKPSVTSPSQGMLGPGSAVTAESFVFTGEVEAARHQYTGELGWYFVSGALSGYIRADLLSVPFDSQGRPSSDCSLRNEFSRSR
jgi:hypothetical protein